MLQNAYFLAKIGADAAENEQHFAEILPKNGNYPTGPDEELADVTLSRFQVLLLRRARRHRRQNVARFRLYRLRFLQENMRFAAFFKIYEILKLKFLKFDQNLLILRHLQFFC